MFFGARGDVHKTLCVYLVALGLVKFVTDTIKNYVGYLRPCFYDLCNANFDNNNDDGGGGECQNVSASMDGRKSFPSGHSSFSFCGFMLLSLYLSRQFGSTSDYKNTSVSRQMSDEGYEVWVYRVPKKPYNNNNNNHNGPALKRAISILCMSPLLVAFFISTSRIYDNKHFPADVVGGSILGAAIAVFVSDLWYVFLLLLPRYSNN